MSRSCLRPSWRGSSGGNGYLCVVHRRFLLARGRGVTAGWMGRTVGWHRLTGVATGQAALATVAASPIPRLPGIPHGFGVYGRPCWSGRVRRTLRAALSSAPGRLARAAQARRSSHASTGTAPSARAGLATRPDCVGRPEMPRSAIAGYLSGLLRSSVNAGQQRFVNATASGRVVAAEGVQIGNREGRSRQKMLAHTEAYAILARQKKGRKGR